MSSQSTTATTQGTDPLESLDEVLKGVRAMRSGLLDLLELGEPSRSLALDISARLDDVQTRLDQLSDAVEGKS